MKLYAQIISENEHGLSWSPRSPGLDWLPVIGEWQPGMVLVPGEQDGEPVLFAREREKTADEIVFEAQAAVRSEIAKTYSASDEIKLLNAAVEALAGGELLPKEYLDYRAAVRQIREGKAT